MLSVVGSVKINIYNGIDYLMYVCGVFNTLEQHTKTKFHRVSVGGFSDVILRDLHISCFSRALYKPVVFSVALN